MWPSLLKNKDKIFAVAPMMDWTDRHCRVLHRILSRRALLYTEMITSAAITFGNRQDLLGFSDCEHPVALQIGGSDPRELAAAARIGEEFGYAEINLNCGCPSNRVREGRFGACLMGEPARTAECVAAMISAVRCKVTVKCRIGIDEQSEDEPLDHFVGTLAAAGCRTFIIHARKAWLHGLSPRENREVPPLNYSRVYRLKKDHPELEIVLNGGIKSLDEAESHLNHVDGVMLGRAAYERPYVLAEVDRQIFGASHPMISREEVLAAYADYMVRELETGTRLNGMTRHVLGLYHGEYGGRAFRRVLSESAHRPAAGVETIANAIAATRRVAYGIAAE